MKKNMILALPTIDFQTVVQGFITGVWAWVLIGAGVPLAFYIIHSLIQLLQLDRGVHPKHVSGFTAYLDRRRQEKIRRMWSDDLQAGENDESLRSKNEQAAGQIDNSRLLGV